MSDGKTIRMVEKNRCSLPMVEAGLGQGIELVLELGIEFGLELGIELVLELV